MYFTGLIYAKKSWNCPGRMYVFDWPDRHKLRDLLRRLYVFHRPDSKVDITGLAQNIHISQA